MMDFNIKNYDAKGDGVSKDTAAIQKAIEDCSRSGGGTVSVPSGTYLTGTIYFRNHVNLHLEAGAVILGSPDMADYNAEGMYTGSKLPERSRSKENVTGAHLIIVHEAENVAISGDGTIDGNSSAFFGPIEDSNGTGTGEKFSIKDQRPGQMICFLECKKVTVRDVSLNNAPYWTLFLHGCEDVNVQGVSIHNSFLTHNGDGIGIDCCRNVTVGNCRIHSGDDSITLRGSNSKLKDKTRVCENIAISNCVLSSAICGFRVGVGDGSIRNCTISNCVINAKRGIYLNSRYYGKHFKRGTDIENIRFSNLVIDAAHPIKIASSRPGTAIVRNISFCGITAFTELGCPIIGEPDNKLLNVTFSDMDIEMVDVVEKRDGRKKKSMMGWPSDYPEGTPGPPFFYANHVEGLAFSNIKIKGVSNDWPWREAIIIENSEGVQIDLLLAGAPFPKSSEALIFLKRCRDVRVSGGAVRDKYQAAFIKMAETPAEARIHITNNDLTNAASGILADGDYLAANNIQNE